MGPGVRKTIYIVENPAVILVLDDDMVAILEIISVLLHLLLRRHGDLHPHPGVERRANIVP